MRILDRYILVSFLKNYAISLAVLIGLYVVLDMVFNVDDFAVSRDDGGARFAGMFGVAANMGSYYFFRSFLIFSQLSGVIPVVAAAFTLLRLSRFNELTAMMAAGVPLQRVAMPVILCAVVANVILLPVNQEIVIPRLIPELMRDRSDTGDARAKGYPIQNMQFASEDGTTSGLMMGGNYRTATDLRRAQIEVFDVLEIDADSNLVAHTRAKKAEFDPVTGAWDLTDGYRVTGLRAGEHRSRPQAVGTFRANVTPEEIALFKSGEYVDLLPTSRINELLDRSQIYATAELQRVKYARLAQILLNIVMVVLAACSVLIREPTRIKPAVVRCLFLVGACMAAIFVCQNFAVNVPADAGRLESYWPALMAWLPLFLFGPLSMFLLDRVKS